MKKEQHFNLPFEELFAQKDNLPLAYIDLQTNAVDIPMQASFESKAILDKVYTHPDFTLHTNGRKIVIKGEEKSLQKIPFEILKLLAENENSVVSIETIANTIWGNVYNFESRAISIHVSKIRGTIWSKGQSKIRTVHGVGFSLVNPDLNH